MTAIIKLTDKNFDSLITKESKFSLIKFGAKWCRPCEMIKPIIEEFAIKYSDRIIFFEVDIELEEDLCNRFSVRGVPVIFLLAGTKIIEAHAGTFSKEFLRMFLDEGLKQQITA